MPRAEAGGGVRTTGAGQRLSPTDLTRQLHALDVLSLEALRAEWRRLHRTPTPLCFSRDLLLRGITYRMQETALGGLAPASQRRISTQPVRGNGASPPRTRAVASPPIRLKPGSTLVRAWHGETHTVLVREDGFEHQGRRYASLSQIARQITGAHWSDPRFFGLRPAPRATPTNDTAADAVTDIATAPTTHATKAEPDA